MAEPVQIVICIPTYGGVVPEHVGALLHLQAWFGQKGIRARVIHHTLTEIAKSRNKLACQFLEMEEATHLLFIDSDIDFEPAAVAGLIAADKPLVGAVYPKRTLDVRRLIAAARALTDERLILSHAMDYVVSPDEGDQLEVVNGACRVRGVGMGLCLIRREVFTALLSTGQIREDRSEWGTGGLRGSAYGFFDPIVDGATLMSEDLSFCRRWRDLCGGEVWALIDQPVGHTGPMTFRGRLLDAFEAAELMSRRG